MKTKRDDCDVVPCAVCGCLGNVSCGHKPYDEDKFCTLDDAGICPCCRIYPGHNISNQRNDAIDMLAKAVFAMRASLQQHQDSNLEQCCKDIEQWIKEQP